MHCTPARFISEGGAIPLHFINQAGEATMSEGNTNTGGNKPSHRGFVVTKGKDDKEFYNAIGAKWDHSKGGGFTTQCFANPLDGKIVWFPIDKAPEDGAAVE